MARAPNMPLPFCHGCRRPFAPGDPMRAAADHVFHERCWHEVHEIGMQAFQARYPTEKESALAVEVDQLKAKLSEAHGKLLEMKTERDRAVRRGSQYQAQANELRTRALATDAALVSARRDLEERRQMAVVAPAPATAEVVTTEIHPAPVDDAAQRYKQIELD